MSQINYDLNWEKYHRNKPIKEFDLNQTMYSLVTNECKDDMDLYATGFMGNNMTYKDLIPFQSLRLICRLYSNVCWH